MGKAKRKKNAKRPANRGNAVAEWFGHRVWPEVDDSDTAVENQSGRLCPFIAAATRDPAEACIKVSNSYPEPYGVCTVSSDSNGVRQDWLACPYRVLDQHFTLLGGVVRTLFEVEEGVGVALFPTSVLDRPLRQAELLEQIADRNTKVFAFCMDKLGGEVDVPKTDASPGAKVDVSVIEITGCEGNGLPSSFGKHMFFEIQAADFHGSPLHAVKLLADKCPQGAERGYHEAFRARPDDCAERMEGPNKANIFKRTIYQMILKMELAARDEECVGFAIVLPVPVWDSWLRHLGLPALESSPDDPSVQRFQPVSAATTTSADTTPSWIVVFDIDRESGESPQPLRIVNRIAASPEALIHYAFNAAPAEAIERGAVKRFRSVLIERVTRNWEE